MQKIGRFLTRIKRIRVHFGLSRTQFAQRINKSPSHVFLVENGKKNYSNETIEKICSLFSVNKEWLLTGDGEMTPLPEINKEDIGRRIREVRIDKGLTQEEFGKRIGYTNSQIWFAENRRIDASNPIIQEICTVFGISRDWLLTGVGWMYSSTQEELPSLSVFLFFLLFSLRYFSIFSHHFWWCFSSFFLSSTPQF